MEERRVDCVEKWAQEAQQKAAKALYRHFCTQQLKYMEFFFVASGFVPELSYHLPSSAVQVSSREEGEAPQLPLHPKH